MTFPDVPFCSVLEYHICILSCRTGLKSNQKWVGCTYNSCVIIGPVDTFCLGHWYHSAQCPYMSRTFRNNSPFLANMQPYGHLALKGFLFALDWFFLCLVAKVSSIFIKRILLFSSDMETNSHGSKLYDFGDFGNFSGQQSKRVTAHPRLWDLNPATLCLLEVPFSTCAVHLPLNSLVSQFSGFSSFFCEYKSIRHWRFSIT